MAKIIVVAPVFLFAAAHVVGVYYPKFLWGADQLYYHGSAYKTAFGCWTVVIGVIAVRSRRLGRGDAVLRSAVVSLQRPFGSIVRPVCLLFFLFFAYVFRVREHTLGDSVVWFRDLSTHYSNDPASSLWSIVFSVPSFDHIPTNEFLDFLLHIQLYRLGSYLFQWSPSDAYEFLSYAAGVLYVIAAWKVAAGLGKTALRRLTFFASLCSLGSMQLFFGYGESYTLVTVAAVFFVLAALRFLRGDSPFAAPCIWLAVCCSLHIMAVSLVPSLVYLLWRDRGQPGRDLLARRGVVVGVLGIGGVLALYLYSAIYPHNMPLWTARTSGTYALFSLGHGVLLLNAILLVSPLGLIWGITGIKVHRSWDSEVWFLAWAVIGTLGLIAVHNAYLGGRDWDLLSFPGTFYTLWGVACIGYLPQRRHLYRQVRLVAVPIVGLHTALWIGINGDSGRALARMENLLEVANQPDHYRHFSQGYHYFSLGEGYEQKAVFIFCKPCRA